jgi:hypothetical protein
VTKPNHPGAEPDTATLVKEIIHDSEALVGQQLLLLRREVQDEVALALRAAALLGAGAGMVAIGGAFSAVALVHALHRSTRLPLWGCYGLMGALLGAAGAGFLADGRARASGVRLPPPETAAALRENLEWLKEQVS